MLHPPHGLSDDDIRSLIADGWDVDPVSVEYRAVGFGSHHWEVVGADDARWFLNLDELAARSWHPDEPPSGPRARLRAAMTVPRALYEAGYDFPVAPIPGRDGDVLRELGPDYAAGLVPFVVGGESFAWAAEGWDSPQVRPEHRRAIVDMIGKLHTAPRAAWGSPQADDFAVQQAAAPRILFRTPPAEAAARGPFGAPAQELITSHIRLVKDLFDHYATLVERALARPDHRVLTHGEPHPGNTMRVGDRFRLIDWDTALVAPPERDLWDLKPDMVARYTELTAIEPDPPLLDLYRLRWALTDITTYCAVFAAPHTDGPNEAASWRYLNGTLAELAATHR